MDSGNNPNASNDAAQATVTQQTETYEEKLVRLYFEKHPEIRRLYE